MRLGLRSLAKSAVRKLGYDLRRCSLDDHRLTFFHGCLHGLLYRYDSINIVQVGANDGKVNDPIYDFIARHRSSTQVVLVEPQEALIPYLLENYKLHNSKYVFQGAVGPAGDLQLYRVKPEEWTSFEPEYARGWPSYRAPTGITSGNFSHVKRWVKKHYRGKLHAESTIEEISVRSLPLVDVISEAQLFEQVHVLLVDAEGCDDQVIYHSSIAETKPTIIGFEIEHLSLLQVEKLRSFLESNDYELYVFEPDAVALRRI